MLSRDMDISYILIVLVLGCFMYSNQGQTNEFVPMNLALYDFSVQIDNMQDVARDEVCAMHCGRDDDCLLFLYSSVSL